MGLITPCANRQDLHCYSRDFDNGPTPFGGGELSIFIRLESIMNKKITAVVLSATLLGMASVPALAQEQESSGYFGVNYAALGLVSSNETELDTPVVFMTPGLQVNSIFAVEGRAGFGVDTDRIGSIEFAVQNYFGVFARLGAPVNPRFYPYLMLGYGLVKIDSSIGSSSVKDFAYGIGANFGFTENFFGKVEYMNYYDEDGLELSGGALGIEYRF